MLLFLMLGGSFFVISWRIGPYFKGLFLHPEPPQATALADKPEPLPESEAIGIRDQVRAINLAIKGGEWGNAATQADLLAADRDKSEILKRSPRALEWVYEVRVAGRMTPVRQPPEPPGDEAVLAAQAAYDEYTKFAAGKKPGFRLQYNALLARFYQAGGPSEVSLKDATFNQNLLGALLDLERQFGANVEKGQRHEMVRTVRAYTLWRLLAEVPKEVLTGEKPNPKALQQWNELHDLLTDWHTQLGLGWTKSKDLAQCEKLYWGRWWSFFHWWTRSLKLGEHEYARAEIWRRYDEAQKACTGGNGQ